MNNFPSLYLINGALKDKYYLNNPKNKPVKANKSLTTPS